MMRFLLGILLSGVLFSAMAQQRGDIYNYTLLETWTSDSFNLEVERLTGFPGAVLGIKYDFEVYKVQYYTPDYNPDSLTIATGLVTIPTNYPCASGIYTFGHGLCLKDSEAPSNPSTQYGMITKGLAGNGFIGVAPDYIHLGADASPGFQAFMNAKTEATATIDLIRAAKTIAQGKGTQLTDQLFLSGYSQGGHSSFATAREIQLYHANEFTVTAVCPGGGTFDLSGIAADSLSSDTRVTPEPHAFCLIIQSYAHVYEDSLINLGLSGTAEQVLDTIFKSPYDSILKIMLDRTTSLYDRNLLDSIPVRMLNDSFRIAFQTDPNFYFRKLLSYNNLYDWVPQMPVTFVHSSADIENPISNVQYVMQLFEDNGATADIQLSVISTTLSHGQAGLPYVIFSLDHLRSKRVDCLTGIAETAGNTNLDWNIYPNPVQNDIIIRWEKPFSETIEVNVYSSSGSLVSSTKAGNGTGITIAAQTLPAGRYVVELNTGLYSYYRVAVKL